MPVFRNIAPDPWELRAASRASLGLEGADLVIENASLVDVWGLSIVDGVDVAIKGRLIACVGSCRRSKSRSARVVDLGGKILAPGFIDAHVHVESTFLRPAEFAKAVISRGTTAVFADPHEIANVAGFQGIEYMASEFRESPLKVFLLIPPSVPASRRSPDRGGASLEYREVLSRSEGFSGVGEVMDLGSFLDGDEEFLVYASRLAASPVIQGHGAGLRGEDLDAYASLGINNDHEVTSYEELLERLRRGVVPMVRFGSSWRDLDRLWRALQDFSPLVPLVSDDIHAAHIASEGHLDRAVRRAVELGVDPLKALRSVTLAPAILFGIHRWLGSIAPGRYADMVVLSDIRSLRVEATYVDGSPVFSKELGFVGFGARPDPSERILRIFSVPENPSLAPRIPEGFSEVDARVVVPVHGTPLTREEILTVDLEAPLHVQGLSLASVVNRYGSGRSFTGFLGDLALRGSVSSTVAHDSHNIIIVGSSPKDLKAGLEALSKAGGGLCVYREDQGARCLELSIAGLMSSRPFEEVASDLESLLREMASIGIRDPEAVLHEIQLLSLTVIPRIRITDNGLYDVVERRPVDLVVGLRRS